MGGVSIKKVGMVLEGGGLRSLYTAGVLDALIENNIKVDGIIGVSAAAVFGVNYLSNQKGRAIRCSKSYCKDRHYKGFLSLLFTGNYINKDFAYYKMDNELDQFDNLKFINGKKKYYVAATKVEDGTAEYFNINNPLNQTEELRATSAGPLISRIIKIDDIGYLDGSISDCIPIEKCISLGYEKRIVIETQPLNFRKKDIKKSKARLIKLRYMRYPKLVEAILNKTVRYNKTKEKLIDLEKKEEAFAIRPIKQLDIDIKCRNPKKLQEIYDRGFADGLAALKGLEAYLQKGEKRVAKKKNTKKEVTTEKKSTAKKNTTSKTKKIAVTKKTATKKTTKKGSVTKKEVEKKAEVKKTSPKTTTKKTAATKKSPTTKKETKKTPVKKEVAKKSTTTKKPQTKKTTKSKRG